MKSSQAVFTKKNPFPPEPRRARSHYSPTRAKKIPKQKKKLVLSPVRITQSLSPPESPPPSSPEDQHFLNGSNNVLLCPHRSVLGEQNLSESWPSTDQSSSPVSTDVHPQHTVASETHEPSVMEKYIERFRYGRPKRREERQQLETDGADNQPFWWMSSNPSSLISTQTTKECFGESFEYRNDCTGSTDNLLRHQEETRLSPSRGQLDMSALALSDTLHCEQAEPGILQLQERARRLLQRSEHSQSSGSSSAPISSEGLGCSDFSDPVGVDEPIRKPTFPSLIETANFITPRGLLPAVTAQGPVGSRPRPEDDILFRWRLRRKMEQAKQWSHTSSYGSAHHQPLLSRLALQTQPGLSVTYAPTEVTSSVSAPACCPVPEPVLSSSSQIQPASSIHTMADFLPQSHMASVPPCDRVMTNNPPQTAHPFSLPCLREHVCCTESSTELSNTQQYSSSPSQSPQSAENSEGAGCHRRVIMQTNSRVDGKKASTPCTRNKNSDRYVKDRDMVERNQQTVKARDRHARGQEKARSKNKEHAGHKVSQISTQSIPPRDSPSPIHTTLGQVVSAVLFPRDDSSVQPRTSHSPTSPRYTSPESPHSPVPPPQHSSQTSEVIGQLMQEAQDSDGLEFEDDHILIVLRQQRQWMKAQLCDVDKMLEKSMKTDEQCT